MKSDVQLNLRAKESQRALIDAAAEILHKSRTDFIPEMACKAAENVILDRRVFNFNDEQYAEFIPICSMHQSRMRPPLINYWQGNLSGTYNSARAVIQRSSAG
jgi:uncharacterized protein (DUF1778 family)